MNVLLDFLRTHCSLRGPLRLGRTKTANADETSACSLSEGRSTP
jgi:hypothetical protein